MNVSTRPIKKGMMQSRIEPFYGLKQCRVALLTLIITFHAKRAYAGSV